MIKIITAAALIVALSVGTIATTSPADAGPNGGFSIDGQGQGNPFGGVNGR